MQWGNETQSYVFHCDDRVAQDRTEPTDSEERTRKSVDEGEQEEKLEKKRKGKQEREREERERKDKNKAE